MEKKQKSPFFRVKEEFGGGLTSSEELEAELKLWVAKGILIKKVENGEIYYKNSPKFDAMTKEEQEKILFG